jgi:hypothetical protein
MGRETAWNMWSLEDNKEYCITLHLVGYTLHILIMHGPMNIKRENTAVLKSVPSIFTNTLTALVCQAVSQLPAHTDATRLLSDSSNDNTETSKL